MAMKPSDAGYNSCRHGKSIAGSPEKARLIRGRNGAYLTPPCTNTSRFGQTSRAHDASRPRSRASSTTRSISTIAHDGMPEMNRMSWSIVRFAIASIFAGQSLIKAISGPGE